MKKRLKRRYAYIMLILVVGIIATAKINAGDEQQVVPLSDEAQRTYSRVTNIADKDKEALPLPESNENTASVEESFSPQLPMNGEIIKEYSDDKLVYSKTLKDYRVHNGIDIKGKILDKVCASEKGVVERVDKDKLMGIYIVIDHENGIKTIYSNLSSTEMVKKGDRVEKGDIINGVGDTALLETGEEAHLHFEMLVNDIYVNPLDYIIQQ